MIIPMSPGLKAEGTVSFEKPGLSSIIVLCFCVASKVCCRLIEPKTIFMYHIPPCQAHKSIRENAKLFNHRGLGVIPDIVWSENRNHATCCFPAFFAYCFFWLFHRPTGEHATQ